MYLSNNSTISPNILDKPEIRSILYLIAMFLFIIIFIIPFLPCSRDNI